MNVTYPIVDSEILEFAKSKKAVLLVEEGHPKYIEQELHTILRQAGCETILNGKDMISDIGEYTCDVIKKGLEKFVDISGLVKDKKVEVEKIYPDCGTAAPRRDFAPGCPERPMFTAIQLVEKDIGAFHVSAGYWLPFIFHITAV